MGSAPAGEDREIRETCWARREKVTETVTRLGKLNGVTETCTREITNAVTEIKCTVRREVTELTETREAVRIPALTDLLVLSLRSPPILHSLPVLTAPV